MLVKHLACEPFVNASEEIAFLAVRKYLSGLECGRRAIVITNLANAIGNTGQPDEVDMIVLATGEVLVIEIKHWDQEKIKKSLWDVEDAADLITKKTKRVAGQLRKLKADLGFVFPAMIFTGERGSLAQNKQMRTVRGVRVVGLGDLSLLFSGVETLVMTDQEIERLAQTLAPRASAAHAGGLKRIGSITDLKRLTREEERFSRVYSGRDASSGDCVNVHLFDLSATSESNAERKARREFEVVQKLQKSPYLPKLVDSFQPVPNYPGELFFFTLADASAPSLKTVAKDEEWCRSQGAAFCVAALRALSELHAPCDPEMTPVVHRGLSPDSIQVRRDNTPLFSGWRWARLPGAQTIIGPTDSRHSSDPYAAPEVRKNGLSFADARSDVYSLSKALLDVLPPTEENALFRGALQEGIEEDPQKRPSAELIASTLASLSTQPDSALTSTSTGEPSIPKPCRWDEGTPIEWEGGHYKVVSELGTGATGRTYKLEQIDPNCDASLGTFVGKVVTNPEVGKVALNAFRKIRSIADHPSLSGIFHCAPEWSADQLVALLKWRKGEPLSAWTGDLLPLLAEEVIGTGAGAEELLLRWAGDLCAALDVLHAQGWVHGDISPSNILVDGASVCLIDFDLACGVGERPNSPGTVTYVSPSRRNREPAQTSDDVFSLGASLFFALTGRAPFVFDGGLRRDDAGLAWRDDERELYPVLSAFLDRATSPEASHRFKNAGEAIEFLKFSMNLPRVANSVLEASPNLPVSRQLRPNTIARVKDILSVYPGSRFGNAETRGLDTLFAADTFVRTGLEEALLNGIKAGQLSLVILCGNAGDGKTALLQHLAKKLAKIELRSDKRLANFTASGRRIVINLDGAASWGGRSADDLMDEIFAPFQDGLPSEKVTHLVAVNDGRLMEWAELSENRNGETWLTKQIIEALSDVGAELDSHISLVELNDRSLVGGFDASNREISTRFVNELIERLVGGSEAPELWKPCQSCSANARCSIRASAEMMGASMDLNTLAAGALLRDRLFDALQAVHQRDEIYITARELKAALSYILFGIYACEDLHRDPSIPPHDPSDFAFNPNSPLRQGELLRELARLDPALEANSRIDRYLTSPGAPSAQHGAPRYPELSLRQARRRAYFTWTNDQIEAVGGVKGGLSLAQGRHFADFRNFPLLPEGDRETLRDQVCRGLSRLEALPDAAFQDTRVAPVLTVPRTPTETGFWVRKPFSRFRLEAEQFIEHRGLETLHRHLVLTYRSPDGWTEQLRISLPLFGLLRDLTDGVQLLDTFSDDVFANLSVFTQRLSQEDERALVACTPTDEERVYWINIARSNAEQVIVLQPAGEGGG